MSATDGHHDAAHAGHGHDHGHDHAETHFSRTGYLTGFLLSVVLTAIPFWLVMTGSLSTSATAAIIIAFAILQIMVHTICFLHVNSQAEGGWTLMAYVFTGVLVLITISGSLWIMYHLNANMMVPMPAGGMGS